MTNYTKPNPPEYFFNYRVIKDHDENGHMFYSIRGVHYGNYGKEIQGWDADPLNLAFNQGDSISSYLETVSLACNLPLLCVIDDKLVTSGTRAAESVVSMDTHQTKKQSA